MVEHLLHLLLGQRSKPSHCHYMSPLAADDHRETPGDTLTLGPGVGSHTVGDNSSSMVAHCQARPIPRLSPRVLPGIPHPHQANHPLLLEANNYLIPPTGPRNQPLHRNKCGLTSHVRRTWAICHGSSKAYWWAVWCLKGDYPSGHLPWEDWVKRGGQSAAPTATGGARPKTTAYCGLRGFEHPSPDARPNHWAQGVGQGMCHWDEEANPLVERIHNTESGTCGEVPTTVIQSQTKRWAAGFCLPMAQFEEAGWWNLPLSLVHPAEGWLTTPGRPPGFPGYLGN